MALYSRSIVSPSIKTQDDLKSSLMSRRPDFEPATRFNGEDEPTVATLVESVLSSTLLDDVKKAYAEDKDLL